MGQMKGKRVLQESKLQKAVCVGLLPGLTVCVLNKTSESLYLKLSLVDTAPW